MKKNRVIMKNMSSVSIGIMISRILGYFRDMLVASVFGAGLYADAFYAAFRIPNLFRRLFGESSLNAAFVPVFSEYLQKEPKHKTEEFISTIATVMLVLLSAFTIFGIFLSLPITKLITWGFSQEKLLITSKLLQIMFPYMLLICIAALGLSILNCLKVFFIPAMSSGSLSIAEIFYILFIVYYLPEEKKVIGLAISVVIGGFLQFFINFTMVNAYYKIRLKLEKFFYYLSLPEIKRIYMLFIPVVVGFSIDQINALVDTFCASFLKEGSITALYYSNRLMQLPLALFATSLTTVVLPQMSQEVVTNNFYELKQTVKHSLMNIFFFVLPASLGLIIIGKPIIKTLFEHGKFDSTATELTYSCLLFYSAGLIFFSTSKIFTSVFYALKKPKYPVKIAAYMVLINAVLNVILMQFMQVGGLALATSITSFLATILLYRKSKKLAALSLSDIMIPLRKILIANFILAVFLISLQILLKNPYILTLLSIISAPIIYFFVAFILKIEEAKILSSFFKVLK
ncbi:MAG: murein biosynthesis integral membrane protein MurJ [Endomicrobia bacterium]|nr:murein biosynthesis integral membrane protein MurJ [Endomicrobiia bacterium]